MPLGDRARADGRVLSRSRRPASGPAIRTGRFDYCDPDLAPPGRRAVPRHRDVRDRRDPEPDPLPRLPPPGRRLAARVVPDRAEDRPVALAPAVRGPLRAGRPAGAAGRRHPRCRRRVRPDAGPQRHLVLAVRHRDVDLLGAQRARAPPPPRRPPGARRRRHQARRPWPTRSTRRTSSSRRSSTGSASSAASCSAHRTAASSSSRRTARPSHRRRRPTPTGSSDARGSAATSLAGQAARRNARPVARRASCRAPATCSSPR